MTIRKRLRIITSIAKGLIGGKPISPLLETNAIAHVSLDKLIMSQSQIKRKAHNMKCHNCSGDTKKFGKDRKGNQRYRCLSCNKVMIVLDPKPLGAMRLELGRAVTCLQLLVEGCSIRTIERVTNVHRDTILDLLVLAGERCERFLEDRIKDMPVFDVQCDEIWGFVKMKERLKKERGSDDPELGDAYCFVAFERHTKMVLAWHLGRRT